MGDMEDLTVFLVHDFIGKWMKMVKPDYIGWFVGKVYIGLL